MTENHIDKRKKISRLDRAETIGLWVVVIIVVAAVVVALHQVASSL